MQRTFELAQMENDEETMLVVESDLKAAQQELDKLEFRRMFLHTQWIQIIALLIFSLAVVVPRRKIERIYL